MRSCIGAALEVSYVAENYENLHHILVYFTASEAIAGVDIEAEVPASPLPHQLESGCEFLQLTSGILSSQKLLLPGYAAIGKKDVRVQGTHFEVKLPTVSSIYKPSSSYSPSLRPQDHDLIDSNKALLDAPQLSGLNPTSFICTLCSLPLIYSAKIDDYRDLPSEHWEELVETWMCHSDQKLHEHVVQRGRHGFWPKDGQALVGGSYILFLGSAINQNNLHTTSQNQVNANSFPSAPLFLFLILRYTLFRTQKKTDIGYSTNDPFYMPAASWVTDSMGYCSHQLATGAASVKSWCSRLILSVQDETLQGAHEVSCRLFTKQLSRYRGSCSGSYIWANIFPLLHRCRGYWFQVIKGCLPMDLVTLLVWERCWALPETWWYQ